MVDFNVSKQLIDILFTVVGGIAVAIFFFKKNKNELKYTK
jgi:hypothetical protein